MKHHPIVAALLLGWFRVHMRIFHRIQVEGLENIPETGPLIIACNHISNADPPALCGFTALKRDINILAKKELFKIPVMGTILRMGGAIPLERSRPGGDLSALRDAFTVLKENRCLIIFPEGTRSKTGKRLKAKTGVALFAHKTGAPVLSARIFNSNNWPKLGKIILKYGKLRHFEPAEGQDVREAYAEFSEKVMDDIFKIK